MSQNYNTTVNLFTTANVYPRCVTAFIAPKSLLTLAQDNDAPAIVTVGIYMSDSSIVRLCSFSNAANALNYAFMLKAENCPISKNAFALLQSEIKRTGAVSTRAKSNADKQSKDEAKAEAKEEAKEDAKKEAKTAEDQKAADVAAMKSAVPIINHYFEMKNKHPDAIILFRVGNFYETFAEDAVKVSDILGLTLTRRIDKGKYTELAGFPHHALDTYLPKLVRAGHRVAICEQLEQPCRKKNVKKTDDAA